MTRCWNWLLWALWSCNPESVEVAKKYNMKLHVRSSFNYSEGTMVMEGKDMHRELEKDLLVCGVAHDTNILKATDL